MSSVFVAQETALGRRVVIKTLPAELAGIPTARSPTSASSRHAAGPPHGEARGGEGLAAWAYGIAGRRKDVERLRAEIARDPEAQRGYDIAMAALASGRPEEAVAGIARSLERHELLYLDPSPSCSPVLEPLQKLRSFQDLLAKYGMRRCQRAEKT